MVKMLPMNTVNDDGNATAGTITGGPYTGPDVFQENGQTFLVVNESITLKDAIAQLTSGSAPTQAHAYAIAVNEVSNVIAYLYSTQLPPNSQYRVVPHLKFKQGEIIYVRGIQLSEASTPAAEATQLILMWE
jgi:hypothetical protein